MGTSIKESIQQFSKLKWSSCIASLTAKFGFEHLETIENAVQSSILKALEKWPEHGTPQNPDGWLYRVAYNLVLDEIRRQTSFSNIVQNDSVKPQDVTFQITDESPLEDDVVKMLFACNDPELNDKDVLILTLRLVCGMSLHEIAPTIYMSHDALRKQFTRSKTKVKALNLTLQLPEESELSNKLGRVLRTIYAMLNVGYLPYNGDQVLVADFCLEAERLIELLQQVSAVDDARILALSALIYFSNARMPERVDSNGTPKTLSEQNRDNWDRARIAKGLTALSLAQKGDAISRYHLEAAVNAVHCTAKSASGTDWVMLSTLYQDLFRLTDDNNALINLAIVYSNLREQKEALATLEGIDKAFTEKNPFYYFALSECYKASDNTKYVEYLNIAKDLTNNLAVKKKAEADLSQHFAVK